MSKKTKITCYLTSCKYNDSCCIGAMGEHYCTRDAITIDENKDDIYSAEFTCINFENGYKDLKCINCLMDECDGEIPVYENDGEIVFDFIDEDDE